MRRLKVGIVGCGFIAQKRHIPSFLRLRKKVFLSAVCDLNKELGKKVGEQFGVKHVYSDLFDMLSKENLDIVDVCTPPTFHAPVALEAMESGCNVLVEKPMATTLKDCDRMIEAATKNGVKLSIVHNQNFYPLFLKARKLVESGAIGKLIGMRILSLTPRNEYIVHENHWIHKLPGGAIGETGPHVVYMSLAFLKKVKDVNVVTHKRSDYPWVLYDDYRIELVGENMNSSIYVSHASDCNASEVDLFGTEAVIHMDLQSMLLTIDRRKHLKPTSLASSSLSVAGQMIMGVMSNVFRVCLNRPMLGHEIMIEKFVESIINDQPVPVTPEEGRETVRVMEMIVIWHGQKALMLKVTQSNYAYNYEDLVQKFSKITTQLKGLDIPQDFFMVQEFVEGVGYGVEVLMYNSESKAVFVHKRLREYPITGGASTLRISVRNERLKNYAVNLLRAMGWQGVAMVEFKVEEKNYEAKLIEVNGRFWGSLPLAISADVDFPYLLYKSIVDGDVTTCYGYSYRVGVMQRWLIPGDLLWLFAALQDRQRSRAGTLREFVSSLLIRDDIISLNDISPTAGTVIETLRYFFDVIRGKRTIYGEILGPS